MLIGNRIGELGPSDKVLAALALGVSTPMWAQDSDWSADFMNNEYYRGATPPSETRVATQYMPNAAGVLVPKAPNVLAQEDGVGLQTAPTRINVLVGSAVFAGVNWGGGATNLISAAGIAPDGTLTAYSWDGGGRLFNNNTAVINAQYAHSLSIKTLSGTPLVTLVVKDASSDTIRGNSGAIATTSTWQRIQAVGTTAGGTAGVRWEVSITGGVALIAFGQSEVGAFAGPYIPTNLSAVTVNGNQQVNDFTGLLNLGVSGFWRGTIIQPVFPTANVPIGFGDDNNNKAIIYLSGNFNYTITSGGAAQAGASFGVPSAGRHTIVFAFGPGFARAGVVGGTTTAIGTPVLYPNMTKSGIGGLGFSLGQNNYQYTELLTYKFGVQDAASFDSMFAKAQLGAVA